MNVQIQRPYIYDLYLNNQRFIAIQLYLEQTQGSILATLKKASLIE